jgi:hypothetical protein
MKRSFHTIRRHISKILIFTFALLQTALPAGFITPACASPQQDLTIGNYRLITKTRVSLLTYNYTYKAAVTNHSSQKAIGVSASIGAILSSDKKIIDGNLSFGDVKPSTTVESSDTFTLRLFILERFLVLPLLRWNITYQNETSAPTVNLSAIPSSITQGNFSTLTWQSTDATVCALLPDIGNVALNGTIEVTPAATTTYTITAAGPGGSASSSATITVLIAIPMPPILNSAIGGNKQIALSWRPVDNASAYNIYYGTSAGAYASQVDAENATTHTLTGLSDATTYYLAVTALNSSGESAKSNELSAATATPLPPTGTIRINNAAAYANSPSVILSLSAQDNSGGSGLSQMQFSNDNTIWMTPESYAVTKSWTLTSGDGVKTVYVKFKDAAGNWSTAYSASIILDTTPPQLDIAQPTENQIVEVNP